ncbi:MAG: recombinase family protein [Stellaceae bacterium]
MGETHPQNRRFGYARVSTVGQTLDSQLEQLRATGCSSRNVYREKVTGAERPARTSQDARPYPRRRGDGDTD